MTNIAEINNSYLDADNDCMIEHHYLNPRFLVPNRIDEGMWDWNLDTEEVIFTSNWKRMLGYKDHEIQNHLDTWRFIVHTDDIDRVLTKVKDFIVAPSDILEIEMRLKHKNGQYIATRGVAVKVITDNQQNRLVGYHLNITQRKKNEIFNYKSRKIIEMIARGEDASEVYSEIALLFESRYPGLRCSMLELEGNTLLHGGAPSLPKEYCDAVNGLKNGPEIGSCGTSTYTGKRVLVENIETDPKWANIKQYALPHGMRCCWSEPIISSTGIILGAFGMYYNHPALPNQEESDDLLSAAMLAGLVMERDQNQKMMKKMAFSDDLTGLFSRGYNNLLINQLIEKSESLQKKFAVICLDLDNFKNINDSLGHDVGDLHLKKISKRLSTLSNGQHSISRVGGDEFCIVIEDYQNKEEIAQIAQNYLDLLSKPILVCNRKFIQTGSIGISLFPEDGQDVKTLIKAADIALYAAKEKRKNCFVFYTLEQSIEAEHSFRVQQLLRHAIEKKQLKSVYQAKFNLKTGKVDGLEVLCRWIDPELGFISPLVFISIAERSGMIASLTELVMEQSFTQLKAWQNEGIDLGSIAINISTSLLIDPDFIPLLNKKMLEAGLAAKDIQIEITEHFAQNEKESLDAINKLNEKGFSIAIDDFGTGYSSFASLKDMDIDTLKIDKYFIDDLALDPKAEQLVQSMIEMAHALGCSVVAEGVETKEQLEILRRLGCDMAQGYFINKPASPEDLVSDLKANLI